jgi:hypothetical protein
MLEHCAEVGFVTGVGWSCSWSWGNGGTTYWIGCKCCRSCCNLPLLDGSKETVVFSMRNYYC